MSQCNPSMTTVKKKRGKERKKFVSNLKIKNILTCIYMHVRVCFHSRIYNAQFSLYIFCMLLEILCRKRSWMDNYLAN